MLNLLIYAIVAVLPLVIGSFIGSYFNIKQKIIGTIAAFGGGALIAVISFGMMEESFKLGGYDNAIIGFILGGILFVIGDMIIIEFGGRSHKKSYNTSKESSGWAIILGQTLDGIPESIALGLGLLTNPKLGMLVLTGVFLSNLPEAISSSFDLRKSGKSVKEIVVVWSLVALLGIIFTFVGYFAFTNVSPHTMATLESLAAGAILAMLSSTLMPEAYKESGVSVSLSTIFGFLTIFLLSKIGM